ncbi:MFS transporter [Actinokineospora sp. UTMC 2448]|uniref:bifunctional MFS transporter/dTMP kinase n=1 Tax=Actinokineospora sp. UTMC 2448 TaxID=2268449 RepID=UPI0021648B32|nr:MFS transporter [Actinokineospora sp. UTMC 2448]UVS76615.1 Thymidylate kinase [Actinokineospora sp. UTMC 2448]
MAHRVRSVLSIRPFRRLWGVTYLCSTGDWLSLLALTGLVTTFLDDYRAQSFAFAGVVLTQLLPGLLFAPLGGLFADRFDRRKVMALADVARCGLFVSIAVVGSPLWLFIGNFLIGCCALLWIPSKDAAVPNLLRRPDQVETANQLGMVMTYGIAVISGAGLYALITGTSSAFHLDPSGFGIAKIILLLNGALYLTSAIIIATRIPELSRRADDTVQAETEAKPGFRAMIGDAAHFVRTTPLVRGLLIGMIGAFAAAGALIGSAKLYADSLGGGESAFGWLFVALFIGLATGMGGAPKLARTLPHNRLFGVAIVIAGIVLSVIALSPHLIVSLIAVSVLGAGAGAAFLTGVTIIGTQVEDAIRGRINAVYQSLMKIILAGAMAATPVLVGLVSPRQVSLFGRDMLIDGTRPVLLGAGVIATLVGVVAYRQMDDRRSEKILTDLLATLRRSPRRTTGLLIAVEGAAGLDTSTQAQLLVDWLRKPGRKEILLAEDPALDDGRLRAVLTGAQLSSARAQALVAAAVRADLVEREIRPALERGALVVLERFVDSPLAYLSAKAGLDTAELEGLADWATSRLRPDLTVLLDREPGTLPPRSPATEHHWHVQKLLTDMAAADPDHYIVVDGDGPEDAVAERVRVAVRSALADRKLGDLLPVPTDAA